MILSLEKPKKLRPTDEHNRMYVSSAEVGGTYVSNMSEEDMMKWKAKKIGGKDPRIEIRKTVSGVDPSLLLKNFGSGRCSAQMLIIVRRHSVIISSNGRMVLDNKTWKELEQAVSEAKSLLHD